MSSAALGAPLLSATAGPTSAGSADTMQVRWRGHGGGGAGVAAGLMTGLIIGGLMAGPHDYEEPYPCGYYAPPGPVGAPDWEAYCFSRYRSFDPVSGTYLGHDGRRHYCQQSSALDPRSALAGSGERPSHAKMRVSCLACASRAIKGLRDAHPSGM